MSLTLTLIEIQNYPAPPPVEGERGFGFLSSSRSEMGRGLFPPVSPNQERPWEEEGREDTWMPPPTPPLAVNGQRKEGPTTWLYIYLLYILLYI